MDTSSVVRIFLAFLANYRCAQTSDSVVTIRKRRLPKIAWTQTSKAIVKLVDEILATKVRTMLSLLELQKLVYCGAQTVIKLCEISGVPIYPQEDIPEEFPKDPEAQRKLYEMSSKNFSRLLLQEERTRNSMPPIEEVESFWSKIWSKTNEQTEGVEAILRQEQERVGCVPTTSSEVTLSELKKIMKKRANWSPGGIDGLQPFWYKKFKSIHPRLVVSINAIITNPQSMPKILTTGYTELMPKNEDTHLASNYRPLTRLSTLYKLISSIIHNKLVVHYFKNGILSDEQCGDRKHCFGARKALIIDSVIQDQAKICGCYMDFRKACDSVPHELVLKLLQIYGVDMKIVTFLRFIMDAWSTRICLPGNLTTKPLKMTRGVFQGDCLSVVLFWTAINPLSFALTRRGLGLKLQNGGFVSHLLYMDDLKLYASNPESLNLMVDVVEQFCTNTGMEINYDKTFKFSLPAKEDFVDNDQKIAHLSNWTYLGCVQSPTLDNHAMVSKKLKDFQTKCAKLQPTAISGSEKARIVRNVFMCSIYCTFGVLDWTAVKWADIEKILGRKSIDLVYSKMIDDIHNMRKCFGHDQSDLMETIKRNDSVSPLKLERWGKDE